MTQNIYFLVILALISGAFIPLQGIINNKMADATQSPVIAALISFSVGTLAMIAYMLIAGPSFAKLSSLREAPAIAWTGGLLGAFFVTATVILVPRLGVAFTFGLVVASQMLTSLIVDHFGTFGVEQRPISAVRVIGILLMIGGVVLLRRT